MIGKCIFLAAIAMACSVQASDTGPPVLNQKDINTKKIANNQKMVAVTGWTPGLVLYLSAADPLPAPAVHVDPGSGIQQGNDEGLHFYFGTENSSALANIDVGAPNIPGNSGYYNLEDQIGYGWPVHSTALGLEPDIGGYLGQDVEVPRWNDPGDLSPIMMRNPQPAAACRHVALE